MTIVKRLNITVGGSTEDSLEDALKEALKRIGEGNVEGADHSEGSGFYFTTTRHVPEEEWPRGLSGLEGERGPVLVIECPSFFKDPAFVSWLNDPSNRNANWHGTVVPTEDSDVLVLVDPGLEGEGSENGPAFPEGIWNQIVEECKKHFRPAPSHHIVVWLKNYRSSHGGDAEIFSHISGSVVLNCSGFFNDPDFVAWLNSDEMKATWHEGGEPTDWSDTFVRVPSELSGEGCFVPDERFPEHIWNSILNECRRLYEPREFDEYIIVWLRNIE